MTEKRTDKYSKALYKLVGDLFSIIAYYQSENDAILNLHPRYDKTQSLKLLEERLKIAGYRYSIDTTDEQILLTVDPKASFRIPKLNIILFFVTLFSIYFVPVFFGFYFSLSFNESITKTFEALGNGAGIEFTLAMISILFVHEMGHYIAGRRRDLITSWPYFIPAPNIIGTFGAVIKSKSPFWNRRDLIEVGAAGPIAGWIVAVGWIVYGLMTAYLVPADILNQRPAPINTPLVIDFISLLFFGNTTQNIHVVHFEAFFAGWVGMLVTAINMLPIGQLDGGHVVYGLFRKKQHKIGYAAMGLLFVLGYFSPIWLVFAFFGLMFGIKHPPTLHDSNPPGKTAITLGIISLVILIISFTPIPFQ